MGRMAIDGHQLLYELGLCIIWCCYGLCIILHGSIFNLVRTFLTIVLLSINTLSLFLFHFWQLKNMIAALYSSRQQGTKEFTKDNHQFGWKTVETVFAQEMERAENGLSRKVPGLKYAFVCRGNWTRLNVRPANW